MRLARTTYRVTLALLAFLLLALSASVTYGKDASADQHCPNHETTLKIEVGTSPQAGSMYEVNYVIDGPTVTFDMVMAFCVKASDFASGPQVGNTYTVNWLNHGGQVPDISYVVVYEILVPPPPNGCRDYCTPEPSVNETPAPSETESSTQMPEPSEAPPTALLPNTATSAYSNQAALISFGLLLIAAGLYAFGTRFRKP